MRVTTAIEFSTTNIWFQARLGVVPKDIWIQACQLIGIVEQWHDNKVHFIDIVRTLGDIAQTAGRGAGLIPHPYAQIASQVLQWAGAGASGIGKAYGGQSYVPWAVSEGSKTPNKKARIGGTGVY
jgi:hypothetical protein